MKKWIDWLKKSSPWIFLLIGPVLNFYLLEWYTHNPFQTMKPYIQGMNLALFEFAALFLFALTGRISRALGIETAFCAVYGLANYFVLEFRGAPIQPWDILSISTAASVADNYEYKLNRTAVIVLICFVLLLVLEFSLKKGFPKKNKKARIARVCLALSCGLLCFGYTKMLHSEDIVEQKLHLYNKLFTPTTIQFKNGTVTAFLMELQYISVDKPSGYSAENAKELLASYDTGSQEADGTSSDNAQKPNIIVIMNEAFSDLTDQPMFNWTEETDPLPNLHALREDPHVLSGHIVVPGFAGGTANTEFDALTGMQTNALSVTATSAMRVVNRNLDSLFRVFGADGYRTSFYHPGDAWFYNRENVYRWLGAEHEVFAKDMKDLEYKGRWVTDDYMAGLIEEEFETAVSEGRPLFNYTTTIQNHMSYTADKYGEGYVFPPVSTTADISPETRTMLEVYTEGVRDADAMLGRLTAYFAEREEPVVLVFYGDHLPYLGDNQKGYAELGSEVSIPENEREDILCSYKTPYVLWANDAAADTLNWNEAVAALDLPEDGVLSASFLGSVLLDLTGRAGESPWFDFLSSLRRIAPVVQKKTYILADGSVLPQRILNEQTDESSMELKDAVRKWRCWSYYKLKYADVG